MRKDHVPEIFCGAATGEDAPSGDEAAAAGGARLAWVPGERAPALRFRAPRIQRASTSTLQRIAFHALHDKVAEPMAAIRYAVPSGGIGASGDGALAIIADAAETNAWLEEAERGGWSCAALLPDYLSPPWRPGIWTVEATADRTVVRFERFEGFSAEPELARAVLTRRLAEGTPETVLLLAAPDADTGELESIFEAAGVAVRRRPDDPAFGDPLPARLVWREREASLVPPPAGILGPLRPWGAPAILVLFALLAWAAHVTVDLRRSSALADGFAGRTVALFREAIDADAPIVDLRIQTGRRLDALKTVSRGDGFLELLSRAEVPLSAPRVTVNGLHFRDGDGLRAEVVIPDFAAHDALVAALADTELSVEVVRSGATAGEGVRSILLLRIGRR